MRGRGGDFPALFFQRGATRSRLPPRSAMDGRHWRPSPPLYPPTGERSHLPVRSALGKRHRRLTPPPYPLLRGVNFYLAASFADAKLDRASRTAVRLGSCAHPPKGSLVLDLLQKGFPKNNTRLRLPLPARLCRATSPTGGGKSRLPLWGSCHGIAVTERGEPGTYPRPQPKIPAGEAQRNFPVPSGHRLKSRSAPQRRDFPIQSGYGPSPAPAPGSGSRRGAAGGWARRRGLRRAAPGPPGA